VGRSKREGISMELDLGVKDLFDPLNSLSCRVKSDLTRACRRKP
jgi:hypothetical protein